jgi:hypothetical protein
VWLFHLTQPKSAYSACSHYNSSTSFHFSFTRDSRWCLNGCMRYFLKFIESQFFSFSLGSFWRQLWDLLKRSCSVWVSNWESMATSAWFREAELPFFILAQFQGLFSINLIWIFHVTRPSFSHSICPQSLCYAYGGRLIFRGLADYYS